MNTPPGKNAPESDRKPRPIGNRASRRPEATSQIEKPSGDATSAVRSCGGDERTVRRESRGCDLAGGFLHVANPVLRNRRPRAEGPLVPSLVASSLPSGDKRHPHEAWRGAEQHDDLTASPAPEVAPDERAWGLAAGIERDIAEDLLGPFGLGGVEGLGGQSKLRTQRVPLGQSRRESALRCALRSARSISRSSRSLTARSREFDHNAAATTPTSSQRPSSGPRPPRPSSAVWPTWSLATPASAAAPGSADRPEKA